MALRAFWHSTVDICSLWVLYIYIYYRLVTIKLYIFILTKFDASAIIPSQYWTYCASSETQNSTFVKNLIVLTVFLCNARKAEALRSRSIVMLVAHHWATSCYNKKDGYRQRNVRQFLQSAKAHFGLPWEAGTIAVNVTWMERGFNADQMHCSMYPSIFNRLRTIARYWSEIPTFSYPLAFVWVFPLE